MLSSSIYKLRELNDEGVMVVLNSLSTSLTKLRLSTIVSIISLATLNFSALIVELSGNVLLKSYLRC